MTVVTLYVTSGTVSSMTVTGESTTVGYAQFLSSVTIAGDVYFGAEGDLYRSTYTASTGVISVSGAVQAPLFQLINPTTKALEFELWRPLTLAEIRAATCVIGRGRCMVTDTDTGQVWVSTGPLVNEWMSQFGGTGP
jgi:hypothetical protein